MKKPEIDLLKIEETLLNNNHKEFIEINVIKRDGRSQSYDINKMRKVCEWAINKESNIINKEIYVNNLLNSTKIKLYNKIKIEHVYNELIKTAANKISRVQPLYENIAARLLLLKIYKETWNIKKTDYPCYHEVYTKGLNNKIYNTEVFNSYTEDELTELGNYITQERDFIFTYKSLSIMSNLYCLFCDKNKRFELPQHVYLRVALSLFYKEPKNERINFIKKFYDLISEHYFTVGTPIILNAGTSNMQLSSCVLMTMNDDSRSIMNTAKNAAIYSKNKGGIALDVSRIRSSESYIKGNNGTSSGPVPFIKIIESTIKAFNQGSSRPGACCIYFQWWNYNFKQLIVLKSNTGTEENRARQLKYAVKINDLLIQRAIKDEYITLFDPKETPDLLNVFGTEFNEKYCEYENRKKLKKQKILARDLIALLFKERSETGNIYLYHEENVNSVSLLNRYINSSNLCTEIALPSSSNVFLNETIDIDSDSKENLKQEYELGEIALCNLASINLLKYLNISKVKQKELVAILVRGLDNSIDIAHYPLIEAKITNFKYRYLGIGVLNLVNYLGTKKIVIDTQESIELQHEIFDNLSFNIICASCELAKIKGRFKSFSKTKWAEGLLPIFCCNKEALKLTTYQPDLEKWKKLGEEIKMFGLRNAQLMAIAPTATSGKVINASESIEPIQNFHYKENGKVNLPTLAPNIRNWKYYKLAFDCNQYILIKGAAIRQCYLDQSQSLNVYFNKVTSLTEFAMFHFWAFSLGIKTFYYCKTMKDADEPICEGCT